MYCKLCWNKPLPSPNCFQSVFYYSNTTRTENRTLLLYSLDSILLFLALFVPLNLYGKRNLKFSLLYCQGAVQKSKLGFKFFMILPKLWITKAKDYGDLCISLRRIRRKVLYDPPLSFTSPASLPFSLEAGNPPCFHLRVSAFLFHPNTNFLYACVLDVCPKAWCQSDGIRTLSDSLSFTYSAL